MALQDRTRPDVPQEALADDALAGHYRQLFMSPVGQVVLRDLKRRFYEAEVAEPVTPEFYPRFIGRRDVICEILFQMEQGEAAAERRMS